MKKVLSLVLAVVMIFGMTVTAFAAYTAKKGDWHWGNTGNATGIDPAFDFTDPDDIVFDASGKATIKLDSKFLVVCTADTPTWANATQDTNVASTFKSAFLQIKNDTTGSTIYSGSLKIVSATYIPDEEVELVVQLTDKKLAQDIYGDTNTLKLSWSYFDTGADKTETVSDTVTLSDIDSTAFTGTDTSTSTSTSGSSSSTLEVPATWRITGIASSPIYLYNWDVKDWDALTGDMTIKSNALTIDMFDWEVRTTGSSYKDATAAQLDEYAGATVRSSHLTNVTVRTSNTKNMGGTIDEIKIDGNKVKITTVEYFMKCGKTEGYFDLALAYKGRTNGVKESIVFTIANEKEEIDEYWTYVDTDDHIYLEATETIRYLEMYSGNNLYVTRGLSKGQKIYCRSDITMSTADEKLFYEYAELDSVYTMRTIGVSAAGTTVQFKDLVDTYFVYDSNYKLIGTTADSKLPWSEKYYLATKKVDLGGAPAVDEAPADVEPTAPGVTDNEGLGGDEAPVVPNANYNPNTGL